MVGARQNRTDTTIIRPNPTSTRRRAENTVEELVCERMASSR